MNKFIFFLCIWLFATSQVKAQYLPNIDFEQGTMNGWHRDDGSFKIYSLIGVQNTLLAPLSRVAAGVPLDTSQIATFTNLPSAPTCIGNYVGLVSSGGSTDISSLSYDFNVPTSNFSITTIYSTFLGTNSHGRFQNSIFFIVAKDLTTGNIIDSVVIRYETGIGALYSSLNSYLPWTTSVIHFNNIAGHNVSLQFYVTKCIFAGHSLDVLFDIVSQSSAAPFNVISSYCPGAPSATLTAQPCFDKYYWYDSTLTTLIDSSSSLVFTPPPATPTWYACVGVPSSFYSNERDTVWTLLTPANPPVGYFVAPDSACISNPISFTDSSYTLTIGDTVNNWFWDFGDTASGIINNHSYIQNPIHQFSGPGNYQVCCVIKSMHGCMLDTFCRSIVISPNAINVSVAASTNPIHCLNDTSNLFFTGTVQAGYVYQWQLLDTFTTLVHGSLNSNNPITIKCSSYGNHVVRFTATNPSVSKGQCNSNYIDYVITLNSNDKLIYNVTGTSPICVGQTIQLNVAPSPTCSSSNFLYANGINHHVGTGASPITGIPTMFSASSSEARTQLLYTASELNAAGITGGVLSALSFSVLAKTSTIPFTDFTIKLACVNDTELLRIDTSAVFTTVYYNSTYNTISGNNTFVFNTKYVWDGISNLLVNICYDNGTNVFNSSDAVVKTATNNVKCLVATSSNKMGCSPQYPYPQNSWTSYTVRPDVTFVASSGFTPIGTNFSWSSIPSGFSSTLASPIVSPTLNTTYIADIFIGSCLISKDTFSVNIGSVPTPPVTVYATLCSGKSYTLPNGGIVNTPGTYTDTFGVCNAITITILSLGSSSTKIQTISTCNSSYFFNGATLTSNGTYYDTLSNFRGCDSIITLNLTFNSNSSSIINQTICAGDTFYLNSHGITTAGVFFDTITNYKGCDSLIQLSTSLLLPSSDTISATICNGQNYNFYGNNYFVSGNYQHLLNNFVGCDSIITLLLTVNPTDTTDLLQNICSGDTIYFGSNVITANGIYSTHLINKYGCDSIINLSVTVQPYFTHSMSLLLCNGDSVYFGGKYLKSSGNYTDTLHSTTSCDTIETLQLTVFPAITNVSINGDTISISLPGASFQWIDCNTNLPVIGATSPFFVPNISGIYAVVFSQGACIDTSVCIPITLLGLPSINSKKHFELYPNPVSDILNLKYNFELKEVKIINSIGEVIYIQNQFTGNSYKINTSDFRVGLYLISIMDTKGEIELIKFIKQ